MAGNDLTEPAEDLGSPINTILAEPLTFRSFQKVFDVLHDSYEKLDETCQKAAAKGFLLSPLRGERLPQEESQAILSRVARAPTSDQAAMMESAAEDVKKRVDRVEERIEEIENAVSTMEQHRKDNAKMDAIEFTPTLDGKGDRGAGVP